jgi:hypothetical protein
MQADKTVPRSRLLKHTLLIWGGSIVLALMVPDGGAVAGITASHQCALGRRY